MLAVMLLANAITVLNLNKETEINLESPNQHETVWLMALISIQYTLRTYIRTYVHTYVRIRGHNNVCIVHSCTCSAQVMCMIYIVLFWWGHSV